MLKGKRSFLNGNKNFISARAILVSRLLIFHKKGDILFGGQLVILAFPMHFGLLKHVFFLGENTKRWFLCIQNAQGCFFLYYSEIMWLD